MKTKNIDKENETEFVWYVSYGSNMLASRFAYYIYGGEYPVNKRFYKGCINHTLPFTSCAVRIPYEMYYARKSRSWEDKGVAFIKEDKDSQLLCRAWLVRKDQFDDIHSQEGPIWYDKVIPLGKIDGIDAFTFTSSKEETRNEPDAKYMKIVEEGKKETEKLVLKELNFIS